MTEGIDRLPCGYLSFQDSGTVMAINSTLASWLGYPREQLIGQNIESIFTVATRIFYNTHFFPLIKLHAKADEIFLTLKGKDNADVPVLANAARHTDGVEHLIHCVFIRLEERKKYEEELLNAKREAENALRENKQLIDLAKSLEQHTLELDKQYLQQKIANENLLQFNKIVSHDLQEPIRKIQIFVDMILQDQDTILSRKGKRLCSKIDRAAQSLKLLTENLQEYVTIDAEKVHTDVDLNTALDGARRKAENSRQFSDFDLAWEPLPSIEGFQKQLELLFFHLIDNAIQFRNPSRKLAIKVNHVILEENVFRASKDQYKYAEHLRITFEDNGIGFPEEYTDYIFQLLKKLDNDSDGLGTGLPLVKKIVRNHYGEIRVTSRAGMGTRFEIELPLKQRNSVSESASSGFSR